MADFVLSQLSDSETEILSRSTQLTNNLLEEFIIGGLKNMLNLYSKAFNSDSQNNLLNQSGD